MDSTLVHQPVAQTFLFRENESRKGPYAANVLPATPVYSRPGSSCSQPPTLYSNGPSVMTPAASPPTSHKASMLVESTDAYDVNQFPSTPPLSASGSTVGSPKMADAMQMPLNPMFSGLDGFFPAKDMFDSVETSILDWSSAGSPPMTPAYMHNASQVSEILSATSCPSLSPSPAPYARSLSSDSGVDFCDPRNLTVAGGSSNPTLSAELSISSLGEEDIKADAATSQPAFAFNPTLHGLPGFEDFSDSEEDFCNLVNLGDVSAETRPRACTGSSIVSLGHGSFIGDDDLSFDSDAFAFPAFENPCEDDCHQDKKQKKAHKKETRVAKPIVNTAANATQVSKPEVESAQSIDESESANSSGSEDNGSSLPPVPSRRGRKQSLTEDPSKTFVCDLCNRRFRRQEHLKRHYRSLHTQEKPFECNECGKKFSRSDNLAQHARTHSSGGIVMGVLEEGEQATFDGSMIAPPGGDDYNNYGKVLFQIASEIPGSASELSSEEASDQGRKKRKRSD